MSEKVKICPNCSEIMTKYGDYLFICNKCEVEDVPEGLKGEYACIDFGVGMDIVQPKQLFTSDILKGEIDFTVDGDVSFTDEIMEEIKSNLGRMDEMINNGEFQQLYFGEKPTEKPALFNLDYDEDKVSYFKWTADKGAFDAGSIIDPDDELKDKDRR